MFNKRIEELQHYFGITQPDDWKSITPDWLLSRPGVGKETLNHIRLYLSTKGICLKDDQTVEYWAKFARISAIGQQMGYQDLAEDRSIVTDFTILIDSREQQPFTFQEMKADAKQDYRPLIVRSRVQSLGNSMGDYSIEGFEGQCHVERKSFDDAQGTTLGWGERREQFSRTLANLADMECAAVVVECHFDDLCIAAPARGKKSQQENAKILHRQILAWQQDFRVPWLFCGTRRFAEVTAFRILERFWRNQNQRKKMAEKQAIEKRDQATEQFELMFK